MSALFRATCVKRSNSGAVVTITMGDIQERDSLERPPTGDTHDIESCTSAAVLGSTTSELQAADCPTQHGRDVHNKRHRRGPRSEMTRPHTRRMDARKRGLEA